MTVLPETGPDKALTAYVVTFIWLAPLPRSGRVMGRFEARDGTDRALADAKELANIAIGGFMGAGWRVQE